MLTLCEVEVYSARRGKKYQSLPLCKPTSLGSLRCRRFRSDSDVTAQVDWARGCRSRAKINLLKIS